LAVGLFLLAACGDEATKPPPPPPSSGQLFYEPLSFCFADTENADTLTVYNLGNEELAWEPTRVPAGSQGLSAMLTIPPQSFVDVPWTWSPPGSYPVVDSLVVTTSDEDRRRVAIHVRREDPAGFLDTMAPEAPILLTPADGAVFQLVVVDTTGKREADIPLTWSEIDDCSGIQFYDIEVSLTPDFTQIVCCDPPPLVTTALAVVVAVEGDQGVAYWRVTAVDGAGLRGTHSEPRSWTVVD
jgi:hypothetical protein